MLGEKNGLMRMIRSIMSKRQLLIPIFYLLMPNLLLMAQADFPPNPIIKPGYSLEFHDEFNEPQLDTNKWIPYYLPHWSSRQKSIAQYDLTDGKLILKITEQQAPWCPEFNGDVKCSSFQTGLYAGELGSPLGQHRFNTACTVKEEQKESRLYTPKYGYFEIRAKAIACSNNVVAFWMIGFEDAPEKSGEICIMEVKGSNVKSKTAVNGYGVRQFKDPNLTNEFFEDSFEIDATQYNIYAAEWMPDRIDFFINNKKVRTIHQSPKYEMQFMLNIYEIPTNRELTIHETSYPKKFEIDYIRSYKPNNGYTNR